MKEVVVASAVRTAIGTMGGTLKDIECDHLAAIPIEECINRANIKKEDVEEVIMGQAKITTDAANLARVAALKAQIPEEVPAYTVMRQCGSGLEAVHSAAQKIYCGLAGIVVAGGVESMSTAPYYLRNARFGYNAGNAVLVDSNTESQPRSQPEEVYGRIWHMGLTAENLADKYKIDREEQEEFALSSQNKAKAAIEEGHFEEQIVPIEIKHKKEIINFDTDEHPRTVTKGKLAKLPLAFKENGTVTAGTSSGRNDGASALVIMSKEKSEELGVKPMVRIISQAVTGVSPELMGIGPVEATKKALRNVNLTLDDIDLIELNEAFAAQALACIKELGLQNNHDKINISGGAIALGHPLGATGAIILTKLIYDMKRKEKQYGLATLCIAGGQGITTIVENLNT